MVVSAAAAQTSRNGLIRPCPTALEAQALPSFVEGIFSQCAPVFSTYPNFPKKASTKTSSHDVNLFLKGKCVSFLSDQVTESIMFIDLTRSLHVI